MHLTKGERKAIWFYALIFIGFMPPVLNIVNRVHPFVFGLPFLLFWATFMIVATSVLMGCAFYVRQKEDEGK